MDVIDGLVEYTEHPLNKIVEAMATNNLGFNPNRDRHCNEGVCFNYVDCRGLSYEESQDVDPNDTLCPIIQTDDADISNLHWHLHRMDYERVLPWFREGDGEIPKYSKFEYSLITFP